VYAMKRTHARRRRAEGLKLMRDRDPNRQYASDHREIRSQIGSAPGDAKSRAITVALLRPLIAAA
jgi:hypothetical protein